MFKTDFEVDNEKRTVSLEQKVAQNKELLEKVSKVQTFKISEVSAQIEQINREPEAREAAGLEILANCIKKTRKIEESNNARSDKSDLVRAGSVVAGPLGATAGAM